MKTRIIFLFLTLLINQLWAQVSVEDSLRINFYSNLPDSLKIDKLNLLITRYAANDPLIALQFSDSTIKLSSSINDSIRIAHSISRKGILHFYLGDYNSALHFYLKAIGIKEQLKRYDLLGAEYNNIGLLLRNMEQNSEALRYFQMALTSAEELGSKHYEATIWNNIGISYRAMNEQVKAKDAFEKSLSLSTENSQYQTIAFCLNNLGNTLMDMGKTNEATSKYLSAIEINQDLNNLYELANVLNNLALNYTNQKEYFKAEECIKKAEAIVNEIGSKNLLVDNLHVKSILLINKKQFEEAINTIEIRTHLKDSINLLERSKQFDQIKTLVNTEKQLREYQLLKEINSFQEDKLKKARLIQILAGFLILLSLVFSFIFWKNFSVIRKLYRSLTERNYQVENLNEELLVANDELHNQRDSLSEALLKLQKAQYKLVQTEKMASLGVLAAGVAHEINNPLNFIQGGVNAIKYYIDGVNRNHSDAINPFLDIIDTGVKRASAIVSSLGYYARRKEYNTENCNVHKIFEDCLMVLDYQIRGRISIVKNYTMEPFEIICNEGKLHQAMLNILSNAVDAISGFGEIKLITERIEHTLCISIIDNGCGIPNDQISKLTDPFFTTKDPGKGTGLGLAVVYITIQELNGSLEFQSQEGLGTSVIIKIPSELSNQQ